MSVIWDLGPHDFSILLYWLGRAPNTIRATGRDSIVPGIADVAFVTMEFGSGLIASVELSWLAPSKLRRTVIVGSKRMVVYEDGGAEAIKIYDRGVDYKDPETFGEYQLSYRSGDILSPKLSTEEPLALQIADFLQTDPRPGASRARPEPGARRRPSRRGRACVARQRRRASGTGRRHPDVAGRVMGAVRHSARRRRARCAARRRALSARPRQRRQGFGAPAASGRGGRARRDARLDGRAR